MPVHRLNHAVLYVRDVDRSAAFYRDLLGFRAVMGTPGRAAFLQAPGSTNDHDLGLFAIGGQADIPIGSVLTAMLSWHALIGIGEALITALVVGSVVAVRPDLVAGARDLLAERPLEIRKQVRA